jgi:ribosomal protein L32
MVMNTVPIDSDTIVCTLKACANCGDLKIAHEVLKSMIDNAI